jgi:hypothetical protein
MMYEAFTAKMEGQKPIPLRRFTLTWITSGKTAISSSGSIATDFITVTTSLAKKGTPIANNLAKSNRIVRGDRSELATENILEA